jgi:hypothetical protein
MPNDEKRVPLDEWLAHMGDLEGDPPQTPTLAVIHRLAVMLDPDDRLRLVGRLWKTLPADHRAALVTMQLEDAHGSREGSDFHRPDAPIDPIWPKVKKWLFDRSQISGLYSAPRRFDLTTIFVVTAAYSLLLGGLTLLGAWPIAKVAIAGLVAIIAASQAMFLKTANPRGVSIITGAVAYTVFSWVIWLAVPYAFVWDSFFFVILMNGIIGGAIMGYLMGTMIGGVFLVADVLRGKFEGRVKAELHDTPSSEAD